MSIVDCCPRNRDFDWSFASIEFSNELINAGFKIPRLTRVMYINAYNRPLFYRYILLRNSRGSFVFSHNGTIMFRNWSSFPNKINSIRTNLIISYVCFRSYSYYICNLCKFNFHIFSFFFRVHKNDFFDNVYYIEYKEKSLKYLTLLLPNN